MAHLYFFNIKNEIDKSIHLLINASSLGCSHSKELLCIALVKKIGFDIKLIKTEIEKENKTKLAEEICQKIIKMKLGDLSIYEKLYEYYKNVDFVISPNGYFQSNDLMSIDQHQNYTNDKKIKI